jgi:hypothetical protein
VRAPNGVLKDIVDYWGAGKATWEPEMIRVPTLLILAEWDQDTPLYMAQEVFRQAGQHALQATCGDRRGHPHGRLREEPYASDQPGTELS